MRVDKMLMATSVEGREPFLDHHLVEFALALPPEMKVRDGVGKVLLKQAVDGLLPHDLVYRKKMGFGAPVSEWFRSDLGVRHNATSALHARRARVDRLRPRR